MFKYFVRFISSVESLSKGFSIHGLPSVQLSRMMNLKIEFAKNKCLGIIWSSKMIPIDSTYPTREHYKTLISCDFTV